MADNIIVKDAFGANQTLKTTDNDGVNTPHHIVDGTVTIDGSGVTQPVSASTLPLPGGASTAAKQDTGNTALSTIASALSSTLEVAGTVDIGAPVAIDQTTPGTTNRVSVGTDVVAISASALPLPVGASTSAKQDTGNTSLASLDTKTPALSGGKVPVVGPTTPTDTQPVSAVSLPLPVGASTEATLALIKIKTDNLDVLLSTRTKPSDTQPVSLASLPLPTGASTETTLAAIKAKTDNIDVALSTRTKPADIQAVSAASLPLPTGASTEATLALIKAKTDNLDVALSTRTKPADTQPISAVSLPLPIGAATETSLGTDGAAPPSIAGTGIRGWLRAIYDRLTAGLAVTGTFWQATQPVSGTVTTNAGTNLNTSALALETGGNLATLAGTVTSAKSTG